MTLGRTKSLCILLVAALLTAGGLLMPRAPAAQEPVRFAWYGLPRVWVIGKAQHAFEKNMNAQIEWLQFSSGASALTALASGQIDIARLGSSATVAAIARKVPIEVIAVAEVITGSERLIARPPIRTIDDLKDKRIAFPPGSTAHYALMAALNLHHLAPQQVHLLALDPPAIAAAWRRGDIDAGYAWSPFSDQMVASGGKEILKTGDLQKDGYFVFNTYVVRKAYATQHPEQVVRFLATLEQSADQYKRDPQAMSTLVAQHLSQPADGVSRTLAGLYTPSFSEQIQMMKPGGTVVKGLADTGRFLVTLGDVKAADLPSDLTPYVDASFITRAAGH